MDKLPFVATAVSWVIVAFVALLAAAIVRLIYQGRIDLSQVLAEPNGGASISRLQLLIFSIIIALSYFLVVVSKTPPVLPPIDASILQLLGISAGSYVAGKAIQFSRPEGVQDSPGTDAARGSPVAPPVAPPAAAAVAPAAAPAATPAATTGSQHLADRRVL